MLTTFKKLRGRSFDELRVRARQSFAAFSEKHGWSSQTRLPMDKSLLGLFGDVPKDLGLLREQWSSTRGPSFFAGIRDREVTINELRKRWPESVGDIIRIADQIALGRFNLLGFKDLSFGDPIDWHLEPVSGRCSPRVHWSQIDELNAEVVGDQKIVRELSRHQYFITLGQAYWLTNDPHYAKIFAAHLNSWMDNNPPKIGTHWGSSLEVAFRSISWLWSFFFFNDSPAFVTELFARALGFLYLNARHLETYLSTYFSPNTHLTGEALGLYYLGTLLPEFREAKRWRRMGCDILLTQLDKHIRNDGVYFEQSSYYQRYTADFYTHFLVLAGLNGDELPPATKLQTLVDHLMYITRPDGTTPLFGDDDGGRLMFFETSAANDFGAVLSNGAALFKRSDYKFVAGRVRQETLWLLGLAGLELFDRLSASEPTKNSVAFVDSGYYVMRDGWHLNANYLLFDCGPHGVLNCGHAHADSLSFDLAAGGRTLLIDPGTYTYTGSLDLRNMFRTSAAHNTLTIDGESSSVAAGPFSWQLVSDSQCLNWVSKQRFDFISAAHDGYLRLMDPVKLRRNILFLKRDYWVMKDTIQARERHNAELHFHYAPGLFPTQVGPETISEKGLQVATFSAGGRWISEKGWVSDCYGSKEPAITFIFSTQAREVVTFFLPQSIATNGQQAVREVEAIGGRGFEISGPGGIDILMLGTGGVEVETARLSSDFLWTWVRFRSKEDASPVELVLLSGTSLCLEGREILKTSRRIEYVYAKRLGDQFTVETDNGVLNLALPVADFATAFSQLSNFEARN